MKKNIFLKVIAIIWAISGVVILIGVMWPIISYKALSEGNNQDLLNPVVDLTKASNWFVGGEESSAFSRSKVSYYNLSVPKLKIKDAVVAIGGEDLSENLIQYPGTALPGKKGNSVIFGHSVLPIFYDPKKYISIFSTLPTLKIGDDILINYDNVSFKYRVESMFEVYPTDIQVLQQDNSDSFLTLVTCVPPGDPRKPRRLIVRARIVPL
ncbi:MAG: sortase [Patescibacteria group bacterium]